MLLKQYLKELNMVEMLAPAAEEQLWLNFKDQGDLDSRRQIIESYQPLVFKAAMSWKVDEPTLMDIIQEGTVGLIEAVENYDHTRGVAFSLYAFHRIRGRMLNFMQQEGKADLTYIDSPLDSEDSMTMADRLIDTSVEVASQAEQNFLVEKVKDAMERLPAKEQLVLSGVFFEDREPKQLAETLDMSISHIYRLQKQGIRRVRGMLSKFMQHW
ncbi:RNA polymerase sigma-E factor [bioreactor metagenome]|uniref:RNA polymerase sigma-E factor n=1 Tax=bioreactor metagenome TaxID=1076179 RepID=A0A644TPM7_9ZZZZ